MVKTYWMVFLLFGLLNGQISYGQEPPWPPKGAKPLPKEFIGRWQVVEVRSDPKDKYHDPEWSYKPNFSDVIGRVFDIDERRLFANIAWPRERYCRLPKVITKKMAIQMLLENMGTPRLEYGSVPTVHDYKLTLPGNTVIELNVLTCDENYYPEAVGPTSQFVDDSDWGMRRWLMKLNSDGLTDKLLLHWQGGNWLILSRLALDAKPKASFDCAKAMTLVEKTLCSSVELASYDVSISELYHYAKEYYQIADGSGEENKRLVTEQKAWIKQRDKCGANTECLFNAMAERVMTISEERTQYEEQLFGSGARAD